MTKMVILLTLATLTDNLSALPTGGQLTSGGENKNLLNGAEQKYDSDILSFINRDTTGEKAYALRENRQLYIFNNTGVTMHVSGLYSYGTPGSISASITDQTEKNIPFSRPDNSQLAMLEFKAASSSLTNPFPAIHRIDLNKLPFPARSVNIRLEAGYPSYYYTAEARPD